MPDNIAVTPGTGATVSTEEITTLNGGAVSAQHAQRVILSIRTADGVASDVTSSTPQPVAQQGTASVALTATEVHAGEVGGRTRIITPVTTVSLTAYTAGDVIGGALTLTNAVRITSGTGVLQSLQLFDAANQKPTGTILLFDASLAGTYADNAAPTWNTADFAKCLGAFPVAASDWVTVNGRAVATVRGVNLAVAANGSQNLYALFIASSTPTFAATGDLRLRFGFLLD
jgi:hypothetical protein